MMLPPATKTRAKQAWNAFTGQARDILAQQAEPDPDEVARRAFAVPVLLRPDVVDFLVAEEKLAESESGAALARLLRDAQARVAQDPRAYPIGLGPVELLWQQVESGERSLGQALLAARALPVTETLTPAYVERLLTSLLPLATQSQSWRLARARGQLVRASADECDRRAEPSFRSAYCRGVSEWADALLVSVPDGALLDEANGLAEERLSLARASGEQEEIGDALFVLAALWTDPYCAGRSSISFAMEEQIWRRRGAAELIEVDGRDPAEIEMPPTDTALTRAIRHWRAAVEVQPDDPATLAGFAETCHTLALLTGQAPPGDAAPAVRRGLELVAEDPDELPLKARFLMLAGEMGISVEPKSAFVTADPDGLVRKFGNRAGLMVLQEMIGLSREAPHLTLAILDRQRELLLEPGQLGDTDFRVLCVTAAQAFSEAIGAGASPQPFDGQDFAEQVTEVLSRLGPNPEPESLAATLLFLAYLSANFDAEDSGLRLLGMLRRNAPLFAQRHGWLIQAAEATALTGLGANAFHSGDYPMALRAYLNSLGSWLHQGRLEIVKDLLFRMQGIAAGADEDVAIEITGGLVTLAPVIASKLGGAADDDVSRLFAGILGALSGPDGVDTGILWLILEFAKGLRTAMLLDSTASVKLRDDTEALGIIKRIAGRRTGAPAPLGLYREFEKRRQQLLLADLPVPALLDLQQARRALDHRTVLISTATVIDKDRRSSRVAGVFWDDSQAYASSGPLPAELPDEDVPWLPDSVQGLLPGLAAQGRDHLCIIPDRGLHAAPWHVYGWGDKILADDWTVSLLPHPHLLFSGRRQLTVAGAEKFPVLAVGVTRSAAAPDLPPLADAVEEAQFIAQLLGGRALLDSEATEQELARLAVSARYLHIACHGRFEPGAPSFHALLLHPQGDSDGILCAWEVAEMDLRAVRLVTLSACETARVADGSGGNADGLPIAFLAAGARAVVGTQWEIETSVSRYFFEKFYSALSVAGSIRDSFRAAQVSTRASFPDHEQWAAFYLLGDWR